MAARKTTDETTGAKVTVETPDPVELAQERRAKAESEQAAALRAQHIAGLETELAYLERTPSPNAKRVAAVKEQISAYTDAPARTRETR